MLRAETTRGIFPLADEKLEGCDYTEMKLSAYTNLHVFVVGGIHT